MTILSWPPDGKPVRSRYEPNHVSNPLPDSILEHFATDIPGPRCETAEQRGERIAANKAAILSYGPRNSAEAMVATHIVLMRMMAEGTKSDAGQQPRDSGKRNEFLRLTRQFEKQSEDMLKHLIRLQARPLPKMDAALLQASEPQPAVIPQRAATARPERAASAVIIALHPAPKMLQ